MKNRYLQLKFSAKQDQKKLSGQIINMAPTFLTRFDDNVSLKLHYPEPEDKNDEEDKFITVELRCKAGTTSTSAPSYKKKIKIFENGTPREYVEVRESMEEVWRQNGVTRAADQVNTVRMLIRGDSFTLFESHITEATAPSEDNPEGLDLTIEMVKKGLEAVATDIFPHRALFFQKRWMEREMKKPRALTTRQTFAALIKINNALPLFPGATETDKYSDAELLKIMEFMLPKEFIAKFDEKGFIPADYDKNRLIKEAEIVERHQQAQPPKDAKKNKGKDTKKSHNKRGYESRKNGNKKYCSHHGANKGHNSDECWALHPELKPAKKPRLSNNSLKKEINILARQEKKSPLEIVNLKLEQLKRAKEAYTKRAKAKKEQHSIEPKGDDSADSKSDGEKSSDSDSESERSCNKIDEFQDSWDQWKKKKRVPIDFLNERNQKALLELKNKKLRRPFPKNLKKRQWKRNVSVASLLTTKSPLPSSLTMIRKRKNFG